MKTLDRNPLNKATLRAERVKDGCIVCGISCDSALCNTCQSILNYSPKGIKKPKLLDCDERELMSHMQKEIMLGENKFEAQCVIDYLVEVGRERFKTQRNRILQTLSTKDYVCEGCGRPINHKGRCLSCNIK